MITTTEFQLVPLSKLVPYQNNARTHSPEQINKLRSSLREFGFINPVIIDRKYGIIAGHGRAIAAREEDITEVPCVFADHLTEAQKKAYIIADNRMALDAGWDEELLRVEIEALQADAFDLALTGFDEKELSKLFDDRNEAEEDGFDVDAELEKPTITHPGDVWTLGRHRLVCGDSTMPGTYEMLMGDRKANLVVTDPPYNVNYEGTAGKIKNDNMASEKFFDFLFDAFSCMEKVMADDASIYVFHADTEGLNFRNGSRPSHRGNGCSKENVSYTLNAVEQHGVAYGLDRAAFNQGRNALFDFAVTEEVEPTMVAKGPGAVAAPTYSSSKASFFTETAEETANTLVATDYKDPPLVNDSDGMEYIVRRLTPTECARLQGFPDWWCSDLGTEHPSDAEIYEWYKIFETYRRITGTSGKPKSDKQIRKFLKDPHSDSAEYKMWGNGVTLPCVCFVLSGIAWATQFSTE